MDPDETTRSPSLGVTCEMPAISSRPRHRSRLRCIGILRPQDDTSLKVLRIEEGGLQIGRDPKLGVEISDATISRQHARIVREGDEFLLEDLGSYNGTSVADVPVLACPLSDGDRVEFGTCVFYFERVFELVVNPDGGK